MIAIETHSEANNQFSDRNGDVFMNVHSHHHGKGNGDVYSHKGYVHCPHSFPSMFSHLGQPVAEVLEYLLVQVSSIRCTVVGSILVLHAWKTMTHQL